MPANEQILSFCQQTPYLQAIMIAQGCDSARAKELAHFAERKQSRGIYAAKIRYFGHLTKSIRNI
jgi:hypothetical protein